MLQQFVEQLALNRELFENQIQIDLLDPIQSAKRKLEERTPNQQMYIAANGDVYCIPFIPVKGGNSKSKALLEIWNDFLVRYYENIEVREFLLSQ